MKKFILLYSSLFLFLFCSFQLEWKYTQYFLFAFIIFQFVISLGTFLLDNYDLKEIYQNNIKVPMVYNFSLDLIFIAILFFFNETIFGCLWFAQSFLIHNTYIKAELLYKK